LQNFVCILNGSPNKFGHTMSLVKALFHDVSSTIFHAYDMDVSPCDDCRLCHQKDACKYEDDVDDLIKAISKADTLVLASPVYFGAMSDRILKVINRFQRLFEAKFTHHHAIPRVGTFVWISTCAAQETSMFDGVKITAEMVGKLFNADHIIPLTIGGTDAMTDAAATYHEKTIDSIRKQLKKG